MGVQALISWLDDKWNNPVFDPLFNQSADPFTLHAWYLFGSGVFVLLGFLTGAAVIIDKMKSYKEGLNEANIKWINLWQIMFLFGSVIIFYLVNDRGIGWFLSWIIFLSVMLVFLQILGSRWVDCGVPELTKPVRTLYLWYFVILILSYEFSSPSSAIIKLMYFNTFSVPNFSVLAFLYSPLMIIIFSILLIFQPRVHYGFDTSYQSIRGELHGILKKICIEEPEEGSMIVFTGHSLGGGQAILAAMDFANTYPKWKDNISILNFGAPRVGNVLFAYHVNKTFKRKFLRPNSGRIERIVNDLDIVARIPFKWNFYQHVGTRRRIGATKRGGQWIKAWFSKKPAEDHGRGSYEDNLKNDGFI